MTMTDAEKQSLKEKTDSPTWALILEHARHFGVAEACRRYGVGRHSVFRAGEAHGLNLKLTLNQTRDAQHTDHANRMRDHYHRLLGASSGVE